MMEFTFEAPAWQLALEALRPGTELSAVRFLALMEQELEEDFEDALVLLQQRDVLLNISDLPKTESGAETAVRLRQEQQLAAEGRLLSDLEENDPLRLYLEELAAIPVCGDEAVLADRCLAGDENAQVQLMNRMLSLVVERSLSLAGHSVLLMDLIQEGSMGAWQAIISYRGGEFRPYCDRCIRHALAHCLVTQARQNGVGSKMRQALEDYRAVDERLLADLGRNPTMEEIAAQMHMTLQEAEVVAQMLDAARTVSRVKAATEEKEPEPDDAQAVEDTAYFQSRARIAELLSGLDDSDKKLISLRYGLEGGLPLNPEETGRKLGLTAAEVINREAAALAKLRN